MIKNKTKKGAASIYAVVFVTLLLGIITVSFVRLIIRESTSTTNSELASSSRDSALAGVEDAKRAIEVFGSTEDQSAGTAQYSDCNFVSYVLYGKKDNSEVTIKETSSGSSKTEQAYTCVKVSPDSPDYVGSLSSDKTIAIIPLKWNTSGGDHLAHVTFSWQQGNTQDLDFPDKNYYKDADKQSVAGKNVPPVISLQYVQAPNSVSFDSVGDYDMDKTNTSLMFLTPKNSGSTIKTVSTADLANYHSTRSDLTNTPVDVTCNKGGIKDGYVCSVSIDIPNSGDDMSRYLVASLPYSTTTSTDFSVKMYKGDINNENNRLNFYGAQYIIDSTGRANDVYTRLEVRLNTTDPDFPYPQFAVQTNSNFKKYFWVTRKQCVKINDGEFAGNCKNSGDNL